MNEVLDAFLQEETFAELEGHARVLVHTQHGTKMTDVFLDRGGKHVNIIELDNGMLPFDRS